MSTLFIWGAGGVGKTHMAIRKAALEKSSTLLITLDPSQRVFDLLQVPRNRVSNEVKLDNYEFTIKKTDQSQLFDSLAAKKPTNPTVKAFYEQMVKGLQDFRDYLTLIQLSDELRDSNFKNIVIDTPPFQDAMGLHRSLFNLRHFFEKSLVQLALKSANMSWVHGTLKKVFEVTRVFSGKKAAEQIFDFIEWLTLHTERFSLSAKHLEELVFSKQTKHHFVLTPESPVSSLDGIADFFGKSAQIEFSINRSMSTWELKESNDPVVREFLVQKALESHLFTKTQKKFPKSSIEQIPFMLMGEDTEEELLRFIKGLAPPIFYR